jgi:prevent-host-death family protein
LRISTADFIKNFGTLADQALSEPVRITKHGRDRLVMMSAVEYDRLKRRDRQVFLSENLPDYVLELIAKAETPQEFAQLDDEVKDWKP